MLRSSAFLVLLGLVFGKTAGTNGFSSTLRGTEKRRLSSISIPYVTCKMLTINHTVATCMSDDNVTKQEHLLPHDTEVITFPDLTGITATEGVLSISDCQGGRSFQFPKVDVLTNLALSGRVAASSKSGCNVEFSELSQVGILVMTDAVKMQLIANKLKRIHTLSLTSLTQSCISMASLSSTDHMWLSGITEPSDCTTGAPSPMNFPALKTIARDLYVRGLGAPGLNFSALETVQESVSLWNFAIHFPKLTSVYGRLSLKCLDSLFGFAGACPANTDVTFPTLRFINEIHVGIFDGLNTLSLPMLSAMNGTMTIDSREIKALDVPALVRVPNVKFTRTTAMLSVSMPELQDISSFTFLFSRGTQSISLPKLKNVGTFAVEHNKALTALTLPTLQSCGSFKVITSALLSLELPSLKVVNSQLEISFNRELTRLIFGSLAQVGGDFIVDGNLKLCFSLPPGVLVGGATSGDMSWGCNSDGRSSASVMPIVWMVLVMLWVCHF